MFLLRLNTETGGKRKQNFSNQLNSEILYILHYNSLKKTRHFIKAFL